MKKIFFIILAFICFADLFIGASFALEPDKVVLDTFEKVKIKLAEKDRIPEKQLDAELRALVDPIFDFQAMARASLSANWNKANPEEKSEYVELFSDLLFNTYLKRIKDGIGQAKIKLDGLARNKQGDKAIVKTKVDNGKEVAAIQYRMKNASGAWKVYDVVIENVGLVSNYRSEFAAILRKDKMQGLLLKLREKKAKSQVSAGAAGEKMGAINFKL